MNCIRQRIRNGKSRRTFHNNLEKAALAAILTVFCFADALLGRTVMESNPARLDASVSNDFHRVFDADTLGPHERLVLLVSASDGAVVSVNGKEIGRFNMPEGPINLKSLALAPLGRDQGLYRRMRVPDDLLHPGNNTIDADVHSSGSGGSTLICDLELKTLPTLQTQPEPDDAARNVLEEFRRDNYIPSGTVIPDGYIDGGHGMKLDADDRADSSREILVVDRPIDPELQKELAYAHSFVGVDPLERARKLSLYVDKLSTPPGGAQLLMETITQLQTEFKDKPLCIGDVVDQCHAGVCRHRSLLFKILADEAGLKTALVRGLYVHSGKGGAHAWNELLLDDGRRFLVDTTLHPKDQFPEITSPEVTFSKVATHYMKFDNTPYYKSSMSPRAS